MYSLQVPMYSLQVPMYSQKEPKRAKKCPKEPKKPKFFFAASGEERTDQNVRGIENPPKRSIIGLGMRVGPVQAKNIAEKCK